MNEWMKEWVSEWINEWMSEWMNEWMKEWVNKWTNEWLTIEYTCCGLQWGHILSSHMLLMAHFQANRGGGECPHFQAEYHRNKFINRPFCQRAHVPFAQPNTSPPNLSMKYNNLLCMYYTKPPSKCKYKSCLLLIFKCVLKLVISMLLFMYSWQLPHLETIISYTCIRMFNLLPTITRLNLLNGMTLYIKEPHYEQSAHVYAWSNEASTYIESLPILPILHQN